MIIGQYDVGKYFQIYVQKTIALEVEKSMLCYFIGLLSLFFTKRMEDDRRWVVNLWPTKRKGI